MLRAGLNIHGTSEFPHFCVAASHTSPRDGGTSVARRWFCYYAEADVKAGEQLFYNYSYLTSLRMSERDFFRSMGFFLPRAEGDTGEEEPADHGYSELDHPCRGLWADEFPAPGPEAHPIVMNFWRFAESHCRRRRPPPTEEL